MSTQEPFRSSYVVEPPGRIIVLSLAGKLDALAADPFEAEVDQLVRNGELHFVLDMSKLDYVGSIGLRVFMRLAAKLKGTGVVVLFGLTPAVRELFEVTKLTSVFRIYPTRAEAIDAVRSR